MFSISQAQPLPKRFGPHRQFFLERVEATKGGFDGIGQFAFRLAAAVRAHDFPEERMIGMTAAVVPDCSADFFRDGTEVADQVLDRFAFKAGLALDRFVQVGDVRLVMFVVMDLHRLRIDVRFQCIVRVG